MVVEHNGKDIKQILKKISKFFWPKKNWAGGVLRERGLGTYTSPTLGF